MAKQSASQKETVKRVMHEYKHGELKTRGDGPKVKSPKQAIAIALHEAGSTNRESPEKNKRNLRRTKAKEAKGQTAEAEREGKQGQDRTMKSAHRRQTGAAEKHGGPSRTKRDLYAKAQQLHIAGRSRMSKSQLEQAVR